VWQQRKRKLLRTDRPGSGSLNLTYRYPDHIRSIWYVPDSLTPLVSNSGPQIHEITKHFQHPGPAPMLPNLTLRTLTFAAPPLMVTGIQHVESPAETNKTDLHLCQRADVHNDPSPRRQHIKSWQQNQSAQRNAHSLCLVFSFFSSPPTPPSLNLSHCAHHVW